MGMAKLEKRFLLPPMGRCEDSKTLDSWGLQLTRIWDAWCAFLKVGLGSCFLGWMNKIVSSIVVWGNTLHNQEPVSL